MAIFAVLCLSRRHWGHSGQGCAWNSGWPMAECVSSGADPEEIRVEVLGNEWRLFCRAVIRTLAMPIGMEYVRRPVSCASGESENHAVLLGLWHQTRRHEQARSLLQSRNVSATLRHHLRPGAAQESFQFIFSSCSCGALAPRPEHRHLPFACGPDFRL